MRHDRPLSGDRRSQLNVLTKEASVCGWLVIDHMALTRVESGRMIREDDDFMPHHMYPLEVSCCSRLIQGSPPPAEQLAGVNSQSVTSTWGHGGGVN